MANASAWDFATDDPLAAKAWSIKANRDMERKVLFAPMFADPKGGLGKWQSKDTQGRSVSDRVSGVIMMHTDLNEYGDEVTIPNVGQTYGVGVHGDAILQGQGGTMPTFDMKVGMDTIAWELYSKGPLAERRTRLRWAETAQKNLSDWVGLKLEETILLHLAGLQTWDTTTGYALKNYANTGATSIVNNAIATWTSGAGGNILYAGSGNAADGDLEEGDYLTARFLDKIQTYAQEDLEIPLEELDGGGFLLLTNGKGIEQLKYDPEFREAQGTFLPQDKEDPLKSRCSFKFGNIYIMEYPRLLYPAANVCQSLLLGANALQAVKPDALQFESGMADHLKRRRYLAAGLSIGCRATIFNGRRRNALSIRHYARTKGA